MFHFIQIEVDPDTMEPKSELSPPALDWCTEMGIKGKTIDEILNGSDNARFVSVILKFAFFYFPFFLLTTTSKFRF